VRALRRTTLAAILATGSIIAIAACGGSSLKSGTTGGSSGSVKIGLLIPTSGVYAPLGTDMRNGFDLYLQEHGNKLGGKTVQVVEANEGQDPSTAVPAAQRLIQQDKVNVLTGVVSSASGLALRDVVQKTKVPFIVSNAGNAGITKGAKYVWRTSFVNQDVAAALGPYVAEKASGKPIYIIASDYAAGHEFADGFKASFVKAGGKVAGEAFPPFGTTSNYQPYLAKIQRSKAAGVFAFFAGAEAVSFVSQYADFGLKGKTPLYGTGFLTEGGVLKAQGAKALGVFTSLHYSSQLQNSVNASFAAAYQKKYGVPPTNYAVNSYDAAAVLDKALASGTGPDQIVAGLQSIGQIQSPRGTWSFDANHDPRQVYYLREVVKQGGGMVNKIVKELTTA
jgi:branched-chain amino acid transport system substrate-binding protein